MNLKPNKKPRRSAAQRPGPDSPYVKRLRARGYSSPDYLGKPRPRDEEEDLQVLKDFYRDFRQENGGRRASVPPPGADQFYRLPPQLRPAAHAYYNSLVRKWAKRIKATPNFAKILHMITLNRFKNPGQPRRAFSRGHRIGVLRWNRMQRLYTDPEPSRTPAQVRHLPTF